MMNQAKPVKWYISAFDIEDRKRAEESLRQSEGYLAEAQRLSHTGSWARVAATGEMRYCSEECYRVLGFDPQVDCRDSKHSCSASIPMIEPRSGK